MLNQYRRNKMCTNCGQYGHENRSCHDPITSFGVINIDIIDCQKEKKLIKNNFLSDDDFKLDVKSDRFPKINCRLSDNFSYQDDDITYCVDDKDIKYSNEIDLQYLHYYRNKVLFLMVSRKYSIGFVDFLRGRYCTQDAKSIIKLFRQMYEEEIKMLRENSYDDLLYLFLNRNNESREVILSRIYEGKFANEYCDAKTKFNILSNKKEEKYDIPWNLDFYIDNIRPRWQNTCHKWEWGFPKGRRDRRQETNVECAMREFQEETGYPNQGYKLLNKIEPLDEYMVGTNGVEYKHVYYLAINDQDINVHPDKYDSHEIGMIRWFTYDEAMEHIRPYHHSKKMILNRIYLFIINYIIHHNHFNH